MAIGGFATFEIVSSLEPLELREKVFAAATETIPGIKSSAITLEKLADKLSQELKRLESRKSYSQKTRFFVSPGFLKKPGFLTAPLALVTVWLWRKCCRQGCSRAYSLV